MKPGKRNSPWLVVDLEATCWGEGDPLHGKQGQISEVIEIGAVILDSRDRVITDQFQSFVKPEAYPILTEYCTALTTITQGQVDQAKIFKDVWPLFCLWAAPYLMDPGFRFVTWGKFDHTKLTQQALAVGLVDPFPLDKDLNLAEVYRRQRTRQKVHKPARGLSRALAESGIPFEGTHHRGIDDARMTAILAAQLLHPDSLSDYLKKIYVAGKGEQVSRAEALKILGIKKQLLPMLYAECKDLGWDLVSDT